MALISIIGTSGVGKSFLVKQLASLNCMPAFFEGEEGTIPAEILENVFNDENPVKRYEYFVDRYKKVLEAARTISNTGLDVYVDGASLTPRIVFLEEKEKYQTFQRELEKIINKLQEIKSDLVVLIIASEPKLKEFMEIRNRETEKTNKALERAIKIQNSFIRELNQSKNGLILDRTEFDFSKETHLKIIDNLIKRNVR